MTFNDEKRYQILNYVKEEKEYIKMYNYIIYYYVILYFKDIYYYYFKFAQCLD